MPKITIELTKEDDGYMLGCKELHLYAGEETLKGVFEDFVDQYKHFYKEYTRLPDEELHESALNIKKKYIDMGGEKCLK